MSASNDEELDITDIGELDVADWDVVNRGETQIEMASPDKKDKVTIKTVSLQNEQVPKGYLIEYHEGDGPYARWRDRVDSTIAPDPGLVEEKIAELIANNG